MRTLNFTFFIVLLFVASGVSATDRPPQGYERVNNVTVPDVASLVDLTSPYGLNLKKADERQVKLRTGGAITSGDISADIINLLTLKDQLQGIKGKEELAQSIKKLKQTTEGRKKRIAQLDSKINEKQELLDAYKKAKRRGGSLTKAKAAHPKLKNLTESNVIDLLKTMQQTKVEQVTAYNKERKDLMIFMSQDKLRELVGTAKNKALKVLSAYGVTMQHLNVLPSKTEAAKALNYQFGRNR